MHIANPIYDVVFKFMMEDSRVAKAFLSAIIGEHVVDLDFAAQEHTLRISKEKVLNEEKIAEQVETADSELCLTVCRMDFAAKISTSKKTHKTVLIELQKAKLLTDIMRFRRYLGMNYQNPGNTSDEKQLEPMEIYCIFLLGYNIGYPSSPVVRVAPCAEDAVTNEKLAISDGGFISSMHHRSWVVQIASLKKHRHSDLEKLLSIFDQDNRTSNHHILNVHEEDFPEEFRHIIRRLQMAAESEKMQIDMEMEDDYLLDLQEREREIGEQKQTIAEQKLKLAEKDKALEEKDRIIREMEEQLKKFRNNSNPL